MQFRLFTLGSAILLGAVLLSGAVNNGLSALCVLIAIVCWYAVARAGAPTMLGLVAVCGWLLAAALIAMAFRGGVPIDSTGPIQNQISSVAAMQSDLRPELAVALMDRGRLAGR